MLACWIGVRTGKWPQIKWKGLWIGHYILYNLNTIDKFVYKYLGKESVSHRIYACWKFLTYTAFLKNADWQHIIEYIYMLEIVLQVRHIKFTFGTHKSEPTMINVLKVLIDHNENVGNISIIHLIQKKRNKNESSTYPDVENKRSKLVTN